MDVDKKTLTLNKQWNIY